MCDFPEHFGEVLGLLLILTENQNLDPAVKIKINNQGSMLLTFLCSLFTKILNQLDRFKNKKVWHDKNGIAFNEFSNIVNV